MTIGRYPGRPLNKEHRASRVMVRVMNQPEGLSPAGITLASGCEIASPDERLHRFCVAEYDYYDAIPSSDPNRIDPVDVLATVSVNSFINSAAKVAAVHRGMSHVCEPILGTIPEDADLLTFDALPLLEELLHAAVQARWVLIPVATKVLHRKRRLLIPMLDSVVMRHYLAPPEFAALWPKKEDKRYAASVAMTVLERFREDLRGAIDPIEEIRRKLAVAGFDLSPVRILEILLWSEVEDRGYYRSAG